MIFAGTTTPRPVGDDDAWQLQRFTARCESTPQAGGPTRDGTALGTARVDQAGDLRPRQPMYRTIDSATAAGFAESSISTVIVVVACTAPSS